MSAGSATQMGGLSSSGRKLVRLPASLFEQFILGTYVTRLVQQESV